MATRIYGARLIFQSLNSNSMFSPNSTLRTTPLQGGLVRGREKPPAHICHLDQVVADAFCLHVAPGKFKEREARPSHHLSQSVLLGKAAKCWASLGMMQSIDRAERGGGFGHHPLTKTKSMPCEQPRPILSVLYRSQGMGCLLPTPPARPSGAMGTNTRLDCPGAGIPP
jgi:hypothetical protein